MEKKKNKEKGCLSGFVNKKKAKGTPTGMTPYSDAVRSSGLGACFKVRESWVIIIFLVVLILFLFKDIYWQGWPQELQC